MRYLEFNTGRQYTDKGQLIKVRYTAVQDPDWSDFYDVEVFFYDVSRMITGYVQNIPCVNAEDPADIQKAIMTVYDAGRYKDITETEFNNGALI